jgi:hypothetical protein
MTPLNLTPDELLSTTRTVRKRLDLTRRVEPELLEECLDLAFQAPPCSLTSVAPREPTMLSHTSWPAWSSSSRRRYGRRLTPRQ